MTTATGYTARAIDASALSELRERDDAGRPTRPCRENGNGNPLRCCLRRSRTGERIALVSYAPLRRWAAETGASPGAYEEQGPVYVHATGCDGPDPAAGHPFTDTGARRVFRRYTSQGAIAGGVLVELPRDPAAAQAVSRRALDEAFAASDVALVHVRAVEYGCFLYEVRRP